MDNNWIIKGFSYWENELSFDGDIIWINIGWFLPLATDKINFQKTIAISCYSYIQKFN